MNSAKLAKIFKALSHPKRLELYMKIAQQSQTDFDADCECFIKDMIHFLKLGAPAISHHIKELENAGLISTERKGKYLQATVRAETINEIEHFLTQQKTGTDVSRIH